MISPASKRMKTEEDREPQPELDPTDKALVLDAVVTILNEAGAVGDKYMEGSQLATALAWNEDLAETIGRCKASLGQKAGKSKGWLKKLLDTESHAVQEVFPGVQEPCWQLPSIGEVKTGGGKVTADRKGNQGTRAPAQANQKPTGSAFNQESFMAGKAKGYEKGFMAGKAMSSGWGKASSGWGMDPMMAQAHAWGMGKGKAAMEGLGGMGMWGKGMEGKGARSGQASKSGKGGKPSAGSSAPKTRNTNKEVNAEEVEKGYEKGGPEAFTVAARVVEAFASLPTREDGWVEGNKIVVDLLNSLPEETKKVKAAFGGKGWLKKLLSRESAIECGLAPGCDEPCYRLQ